MSRLEASSCLTDVARAAAEDQPPMDLLGVD